MIPDTTVPLVLEGDIFERISEIPDDSIDCVVTSPPYWGQRCYGIEGQFGLERTLAEHIAAVVRYCDEIRRVLKPEGTFWLNYGDCYATTPNGRSAADTKARGNDDRTFRDKPFSTIGPICADGPPSWATRSRGSKNQEGNMGNKKRIMAGGYLKPKDLCMIPNRVAIALQDAGWWVRSEIIWHKPNPMPETVKDRPTSAHEKIFLLTKSQRYFYDADAARTVVEISEDPVHEGLISSVSSNWRNVWKIAAVGFRGAHFATFPPALAERCIKAGSPTDGVVLDPFGGAGTTGLVAHRLGRRSILIELNPEYAEIARNRIHDDAPLLMAEAS